MKKVFLAIAAVSCCAGSAFAANVDGTFTAVSACDAYQSFKDGTNPGMVKVKPGMEYEAVEVNKADGWNWIRIDIASENPNLRWVAKGCGTHDIKIAVTPDQKECSTPNQYDSYVLAMTWQPGFCEHPLRPEKPECSALNEGELYIGHLTLHGLWPNKEGCGAPRYYSACADTPLDITPETLETLSPWMPNCFYTGPQCKFADYEWRKHGTCQERDDDTYFKLAIDLLQRVDKSEIGKYLKDHIGEKISVKAYKEHIEKTMGKDVIERMQISCAKGKFLKEIQINLPKEIALDDDVSKMVAGAKTFNRFAKGCNDEMIHIERSGRD